MIVQGVRQFPGFVSEHWTVDRFASESLVFSTYESLAAAEAMSCNIKGTPTTNDVSACGLVDVRIVEIAASAWSDGDV